MTSSGIAGPSRQSNRENRPGYSPGMPAQPSSDVLGFFFDMPAQDGVHYVTEASVLVPL